MVDARTVKNRMEFVKQKAMLPSGKKAKWPNGWRSVHAATMMLDEDVEMVTRFVPWRGHQFFPGKWDSANVDGLEISICPLTSGDFRWEIQGERKLVGDCNTMAEAKVAVQRAISFLLRKVVEIA